jgi:chemotaxis response regulator CheB
MIDVILCDDHALIRRGIRDTLCDASDIRVVGEASDYGELRTLMRSLGNGRPGPCDVLVLDINLPGRSGLDALQALKDEGSPVKVLVVSMYPEDQYALRALRAGAYGYVNKGGDPQTIVKARGGKPPPDAFQPRNGDAGADRQRQAPGRHRREAGAQPQDRFGVPCPRARETSTEQQRRAHRLRHPQRAGGAVSGGRR